MIISQPALLCLQASWYRFSRPNDERRQAVEAVRAGAGNERAMDQLSPSPAETAPLPVSAIAVPEIRAVASQPDASAPLTAGERRARAAALRALTLSRGRHFVAAEVAFAEAARLDPALDLTRTPKFWQLERGAHEAAINAYVRVGRDGDAAVLRARVQSLFRPKPLRPRHPAAVIT